MGNSKYKMFEELNSLGRVFSELGPREKIGKSEIIYVGFKNIWNKKYLEC